MRKREEEEEVFIMTLRKENDDQNLKMAPLSLEEDMVDEAEDIPTTITSRIQRQDKKV